MTSKQNTGLKRNILDKYYTSQDTVDKCVDFIRENIEFDRNADLCIEPSAGNGAFIQQIKTLSNNCKFYDLHPENNDESKTDIIQQDYLTLDYNNLELKKYNKVHIIGNPPFGRQSSLAIKFIKKSSKFCDTISFILPKSFKKTSLQKHFPLNFHLQSQFDLPHYSFLVEGKPYDVPCVFQIWVKKTTKRSKPVKLVPKNFSFVKKDDNPDISFRRVGVYAGKIFKEIEDKSPQSHYFIKFDNKLTDELFVKLSNITYASKNNTCGPKSISKQELIKEFIVFL